MISRTFAGSRLAGLHPTCYSYRAMSDAPRLRSAGLAAALVSLVALSCGSDAIDLLPPLGGSANGGASSTSGAAGADARAAGNNGNGADGGGPLNQSGGGGVSGSPVAGSGGATAGGGGCSGAGCGGFSGFGGSTNTSGASGTGNCASGMGQCVPCLHNEQCPANLVCAQTGFCVQCENNRQCGTNEGCDPSVGRCGPTCQSTNDCTDGKVCDPNSRRLRFVHQRPTNARTTSDPDTRVCFFRRCVECRGGCSTASRAIAPRASTIAAFECLSDKDCHDSTPHCDRSTGHCTAQPQLQRKRRRIPTNPLKPSAGVSAAFVPYPPTPRCARDR